MNLENLGNEGERERKRESESSRFYGRKGDLRFFLEDEISKEMKSSWLIEKCLDHVHHSFRGLCT